MKDIVLKKVIFFSIFVTLSWFPTFAQTDYSLTFKQISVRMVDSLEIKLYNNLVSSKSYNVLQNTNQEFVPSVTNFAIPPQGSYNLKIYYKPVNNVNSKDVIVCSSSDSSKALTVDVSGSAKLDDLFQDITFDKYDSSLFYSLSTYVQGQTALGYNLARDKMFSVIDKQPGDTIECVYSGIKVYTPGSTDRTAAQNLGFNTEHSWPQSMFGSADPMVSDIYHLYPTTNAPNSSRSNYPFGIVTSGVTYELGGSKLGKNINGATAFEPRDVHKGNVARTMLYFLIRFPNNYGSFLDAEQERAFRIWNHSDTVDARERARCTAIASFQGKRNPLIDHPEFVDRISNFVTKANRVKLPALSVFPAKPEMDSSDFKVQPYIIVKLVNTGLKASDVSSITARRSLLINNISNISVPAGQSVSCIFSLSSSNSNSVIIDTLAVFADGKTTLVPVKISTPVNITGIKSENINEKSFALEQNYPNPFNPSTQINYSLPYDGQVSLSVYDVLGNEVSNLVTGYQSAGKHQVRFDAGDFKSGVYFVHLKQGANELSRKIVLMK